MAGARRASPTSAWHAWRTVPVGIGEIARTPAYMAARTIGARRDDGPERPLLAGAGALRSVHGPTGAPERLDRRVASSARGIVAAPSGRTGGRPRPGRRTRDP